MIFALAVMPGLSMGEGLRNRDLDLKLGLLIGCAGPGNHRRIGNLGDLAGELDVGKGIDLDSCGVTEGDRDHVVLVDLDEQLPSQSDSTAP